MNDNTVAVRIVGDASGVAPAAALAREQMQGIAPVLQKLNSEFGQLGSQMKTSLGEGTRATVGLREGMIAASVATDKETRSLREMALAAQESAEKAARIRSAIAGFVEVLAAAFAVDQVLEFSRAMGEAAEKTALMSQRLGISVGDVQRLGAMAAVSQSGIDEMAKGMQKLDQSLVKAQQGSKQQAEAFRTLGVETNKSYTQMELLRATMGKFAELENGPKKVALAMDLFGKSGASLIPILSASKEQQEEFNKALDQYGVINEGAVAKGNALAEAWDANELAVLGLRNVFTDALAPVLTEITQSLNAMVAGIVQSYNEGGIAKTIFEGISLVIEEVGAVTNTVGAIFGEIFGAIVEIVAAVGSAIADAFGVTTPSAMGFATGALNVFKDALVLLKDAVVIAVQIIVGSIVFLINELRLLATVAYDAFTLNWGAIEGDWQAGLNKIASDAEKSASRIRTAWAEAGKTIGLAVKGQAAAGAQGPSFGTFKPGQSGIASPSGGGSGAPKTKDDLVQKLDAELKARQTAFALEQDAQGKAQAFSIQATSDYWKQILERTNLSAKDRLAVQERYVAAHGQLTARDIQATLDQFKEDLDEFKNNSAERMQIAIREANFLRATYGAQSEQYRQALQQIKQIGKQNEADRKRDILETAAAARDKANADIDAEQATAEFQVQIGAKTKQQLLQQEIQFDNRRFQLALQFLNLQKSLIDPTRNPAAYAKVNQQIEQLEAQHQARLTGLNRQAQLQRTQVFRQGFASIAQGWGDALGKMITFQQGFAATLGQLWQTVLNTFSQMISQMITNWLLGLLTREAASKTFEAKSVVRDALAAARGAYRAVVSIPFVGPVLAPIAAAAAFTAVSAFSAAGGAGDVPYDNAPFLLHKNEMVLPASLANPFRSLLSGGGEALKSPANDSGGGGGDFHYHDHTERGVSPSMIIANRRAIAKAVQMAQREGHFVGKGKAL